MKTISSKIDILIGALDETLLTNQYYAASHPYSQNSLTWFVQKRKPIPVWANLFHLCRDPVIYGSVLLGFALVGSFFYYLQQFEPHKSWDWNRIMFNGLGWFWGISTRYVATSTAHRIALVAISFGAIIYCTLLSSALISIINNPYLNRQITSIAEIIDGDFVLCGDRFTFNKISERNEVLMSMVHISNLKHLI